MSARLIQSQKRLRESLYNLYEIGGLELMQAGTRGIKRELLIQLETSGLTSETGEIIRYRAINRWDATDEFDEWVKPSRPLSADAERVLGVANEQLSKGRTSEVVLNSFLAFTKQGAF